MAWRPVERRPGGARHDELRALSDAAPSATGLDTSTPVILLGGRENSLAVARNLGRLGVPIFVSGKPGCHAIRSRYCSRAFPVPAGQAAADFWSDLLIARSIADLSGSILIANCDETLEFVTAHRDKLIGHYRLLKVVPELRRAMLDKLETLRLAREVGVPTPNFWPIHEVGDVLKIRDEIRFPVMVKPLNSHPFMKEFGRKLFIVQEDFDEVIEKVALCQARGHAVMVVEMIPGPDDLLTSYYTYRTPEGERLYDYTKSVIRRWPVNRGGACFHQSEWLPETAEMGRRLFDGIGWQGIGNVEFKRDLRDGQLKIIEVNGRFTAAHRLITEAGAPIDLIVYCHLTGQPLPSFRSYSQSLRMWYPMRDFLAYRQLGRRGELSFRQWLKTVSAQKFVLPHFSIDDPLPGLSDLWFNLRHSLSTPVALLKKARDNEP